MDYQKEMKSDIGTLLEEIDNIEVVMFIYKYIVQIHKRIVQINKKSSY